MTTLINRIAFVSLLALTACSEPATESSTVNTAKHEHNHDAIEAAKPNTAIPYELGQQSYEEGVDYRQVNHINVNGLTAPFITEYFWLSCGHCQNLEEPLQAFKKANPTVGFSRKHAVLAQRWVTDGRLYYALEETNNMAHFDEFFGLYKKGMTNESFDLFFTKNKIDKEAFLETANTNKNIIGKMEESLKEMTENKMTSVPSIVINGKYLIMSSPASSTHEGYFKLVSYLLTK